MRTKCLECRESPTGKCARHRAACGHQHASGRVCLLAVGHDDPYHCDAEGVHWEANDEAVHPAVDPRPAHPVAPVACQVSGCVLSTHGPEVPHSFDLRLKLDKEPRSRYLFHMAERFEETARLLRAIASEMMEDDK